jgi:hypothetical protein
MKEGLERLLKENIKMIEEVREIPNGDYKTGYIQALLNTKSLLEYELAITLPCSSHAPLHVFPKVYTKP